MTHPRNFVIALGAGLAVAATLAAPMSAAHASTPASYDRLNQRTAAACLMAAKLKNARVGPPVRFSDRYSVDVRTVDGTWPQAHMNRAPASMLCVYHRRLGTAEVQEIPASSAGPAPEPGGPVLRDVRYDVVEIGGRRPVGNSVPTLMFGRDGNIAAQGGCNGFGGRFTATGEQVRIYGPMIGTQIGCSPAVMTQERRFQQILSVVGRVEPQFGGGLLLTAEDGRSIRLQPAPRG